MKELIRIKKETLPSEAAAFLGLVALGFFGLSGSAAFLARLAVVFFGLSVSSFVFLALGFAFGFTFCKN
jgi:hypothetical protein